MEGECSILDISNDSKRQGNYQETEVVKFSLGGETFTIIKISLTPDLKGLASACGCILGDNLEGFRIIIESEKEMKNLAWLKKGQLPKILRDILKSESNIKKVMEELKKAGITFSP